MRKHNPECSYQLHTFFTDPCTQTFTSPSPLLPQLPHQPLRPPLSLHSQTSPYLPQHYFSKFP
jgi:hypothetical protein